MKRRLQRLVVIGLERLDTWLDEVPRYEGRWYRAGCWGCQFKLAHLSVRLDERWGLGAW